MKRLFSVILIIGLSISVFADEPRNGKNNQKDSSRRGEVKKTESHQNSYRREEPRRGEYYNGRHYGYSRSHDGSLVWGLVGVVTVSEIIEAVSEPRQRVVYVQQPVVAPAATIVYVQPQVAVQPSPVYIQQLPVVVRDQPLFYYPDGRLVK